MHVQEIKLPSSASEQEAVELIRMTLLSGAASVAEGFGGPDDDWAPIWMLIDHDGDGVIVSGDLHKHEMAARVGELARSMGAVAIGHLHSSWMIDTEGLSEERGREIVAQVGAAGGSTEGFPERVEGLLLMLYSASRWAQVWIPIIRCRDQPPRLGDVRLIASSDEDGVELDGAMAAPLQQALRRVG
jgi:hypothetical protein